MKTCMKIFTAAAVAFCIGLTAGNFAVSDVPSNFKVAVVDVQKVVASSNQVKALTKDQATQREALAKFVKTASDTINNEKDAAKKKALEEKYNKEFKTRQENIAKNYERKLLDIDKSITALISTNAKANGYNLVLAKGVVLSGGIDITDEISKQVK